MNIGILGTGNIGSNAALLFAKAGHTVAISNSKGTQTLPEELSVVSSQVKAMKSEEVIAFGEIILLALPWTKRDTLPPAQLFENKIVIDALNPYSDDFKIIDLGQSTSSEEVLKLMPGARLVKAFNTMYFETLRTGARSKPDERLVLFIAGDDSQAKEIVAKLIEDIGFAAVDTGFLHEGGRSQQPGSPIYNVPMTVAEARQKLSV